MPTDKANGEQAAVTVRPMTRADGRDAARLHVGEIATGFLSSLGVGVIARIYGVLPKAPHGFGFVAEQGGRVLGFIACTTNLGQLYREILGRRGLAIALSLAPRITSGRVIRNIFQTLFYPQKKERHRFAPAEILSVAASSASQSRGLGSQLMGAALAEFRRRGCPQVAVLVGPELAKANRFYLKNGFRLVGCIKHHALMENVYVIDLA